MYSNQLQSFIKEISDLGKVNPRDNILLQESLNSYLGTFTEMIHGEISPPLDLLAISIKLLSISQALIELPDSIEADGSHYLVGMGFEQSGELLARRNYSHYLYKPEQNDLWYRLVLALLHYLAGGHRVQALGLLKHLDQISGSEKSGNYQTEYQNAFNAIKNLYLGKRGYSSNEWEQIFNNDQKNLNGRFKKFEELSDKIRKRRRITLFELGQGNESEFLQSRGISSEKARVFWSRFLQNLENKGITSFTNDQIGDGFNKWLQNDQDNLVILPTGSGKTIIGELRTALTLAENKQVVWILPTKSLLRQARRELSNLFENLDVEISELPTTEDFHPLFSQSMTQKKLVASATPEKFAALIRSNPIAVANVGLVVLDEAHILFDENRGAIAEYIIQQIFQLVPKCKFVFMSAILDDLERFRNFFTRLRGQTAIKELTSDSRPTRRIYGVLTNQVIDGRQSPIIQIFPAGLQSEEGSTTNPILIRVKKGTISSKSGATDIAQSLIKTMVEAPLRTVMFVGSIRSTETQSDLIAREISKQSILPIQDIYRMHLELGRESIIEATANRGIAPHHSGLSRIEQHIVEKWTRDRIIKTVIATSTLAQGVNLPFDISILSFLSRRNISSGTNDPIPPAEIVNMIGRAGRAGQVSDGVCLIALKLLSNSPQNTLDSTRKYFFQKSAPTKDFLGLARLMAIASNSNLNDESWLYRLDNMSFSQAQSLISFSLKSIQGMDNQGTAIRNHLSKYPSIQDLQEKFGEGIDVVDIIARSLEPMVKNILNISNDAPEIHEVMARTGMPFEIIRFFVLALKGDYDQKNKRIDQRMEWADSVVSQAMQNCINREWFKSLIEDTRISRDYDGLFPAIRLWRSGSPIFDIEQSWKLNKNSNWNKIWIGKFFNHDISLFAQFWGALSISEEVLFPSETARPLENMQTFIREGVDSLEKVEWLYRLGGIDRVLAHKVAETTPGGLDYSDLRNYVRNKINSWKNDRASIPLEFSSEITGALVSTFED